jgi:hypothetical protein
MQSMHSVATLLDMLNKVRPDLRKLPVRVVNSIAEVERGQNEGALQLNHRPVVGMALSPDGLFLFPAAKEDGEAVNFMSGLPPGFKTGNKKIDDRLTGADPGDEWKET